MLKKNLPFTLVNEAAKLFNWPKSTLFGSPLKKELGQAKRIIKNHARRLFDRVYVNELRKDVKYALEEKAMNNLISILKQVKKDSFYSTKFTTISMLETFLIQKERDGKRVVLKPGVLDDILKQFS